MSNEDREEQINDGMEGKGVEEKKEIESTEKSMMMMAQRFLGGDNSYQPTEKQYDEVLSQKREISGYIREDRKEEHEQFKIGTKTGLYYFFGTLIFIALIACVVLWKAPDFFPEVLFALLGFAGGYGLGNNKKSRKEVV